MKPTTPSPGPRDYPLAEVETLEVRRLLRHSVRYRDALTGRADTFEYDAPEGAAHLKAQVQAGRWRVSARERLCLLTLRVRVRGAWLPALDLTERQARALLRGEVVNVCALRELAAHAYGALHLLRLRDGGRYDGARVELPLVLLQTAFRRALRLPLDQSVTRLALGGRHRRFWRPHLRVRLHGDALALYRGRFRLPADGAGDLRGLLRRLADTARGYSRHRNDPVTLHLSPEGPDSLYFWMADGQGRRRAFNGGVIWHRDGSPAGGRYAIHT